MQANFKLHCDFLHDEPGILIACVWKRDSYLAIIAPQINFRVDNKCQVTLTVIRGAVKSARGGDDLKVRVAVHVVIIAASAERSTASPRRHWQRLCTSEVQYCACADCNLRGK